MKQDNPKKDSSEAFTDEAKKFRKKASIVGIIITGLLIIGVYYGITEGLIGKSEPFDPTTCHYGVHSGLFELRCITEDEYKATLPKGIDISVTPSNQTTDEVPFRGIASTSDQVQVEKTKDILGYYLVTSNGDWYSDYVDFRKLPNPIQQSGSQKISFRCYNDEFLKTSTYFATFRNVIEDYMKVQVYINDKLVNEQSTDVNRALILEGSCIAKNP